MTARTSTLPRLIDPGPRPVFRGVLHGIVAVLAPVAMVVLLRRADSPRGYVGAAVFATTVILLYATSASYHLAPWPARLKQVMERVDHSMIFVLIAGTYTPFCLLVLNNAWGIPMLAVVWSLAALGIALKIAWPYAPRWLITSQYVGLGWVAVIAAWPIMQALPLTALVLLILGGASYTAGAVVYALRRPDPLPRVFGFHEIFHVLVVVGTMLHFSIIAVYVVR
ncbi:MAG: hemolysin III family protein [Chloroflexi bacterium]|nr:hemolysin III family protein [Chloroflexota bacterium]